MNSTFCTILSKGRLYQAIALFGSLYEVLDDFSMYVLCIDDDTFNLLGKLNWGKIIITHIKDLQDETFQQLRQQRRLNEFCWTLKPIFIESLFIKYPTIERITFMDSDLFFFSDPSIIFENQPDCSVLLSKAEVFVPKFSHEFTDFMQNLTGKYNSGFISFRNDEISHNCLHWWKQKCINNCSSDLKIGSFGDQKYLDFMPSLFSNIYDITTSGVNIGHWNYIKYNFEMLNNKWHVNNSELIFYHFSGFRILNKDLITQIYEDDLSNLPIIYFIYTTIIKEVILTVEQLDPSFDGFTTEEDMTSGNITITNTVDGA